MQMYSTCKADAMLTQLLTPVDMEAVIGGSGGAWHI